eukprot:CAMPEP_0117762818 /NCGR_PEP_ID=MMETSP0947-20121206/18212_1 /TAXON_ID=44440 /ORGANISM="Chattonella subsalsa, Strain CCMP2191" /LENGTH=39 /DNA_ID= /DNA_START= /DNA_END= /DNA_ORIENTATION=
MKKQFPSKSLIMRGRPVTQYLGKRILQQGIASTLMEHLG